MARRDLGKLTLPREKCWLAYYGWVWFFAVVVLLGFVDLVRLGTPSCDWTLEIGPMPTSGVAMGLLAWLTGPGMGLMEDAWDEPGRAKLSSVEKMSKKRANALLFDIALESW